MPTRKSAKKRPANLPNASDLMKDLLALKGVDKDEVSFMCAVRGANLERIPTGILAVDKMTGGGWPIGRVVELAAWENVGKSTLIDQSIAHCQRLGGTAVLIDTERARVLSYMSNLGVDTKKLITMPCDTIEDMFDAIGRLLEVRAKHADTYAKAKKPLPPMLVAVDSIAALPTRAELEGEAGDAHVGVAARMIKKNFRRLIQSFDKYRVAVVLGNQFYQQIGGYGGLKTYGGNAMRYVPCLRVWLTKTEFVKSGTSSYGHVVEVSLKKTRLHAMPADKEKVSLVYGSGFVNAYTLFEFAKGVGLARQSGSYAYATLPEGEEVAFQGKSLGFAKVLEARPDLYAQLATKYLGEEDDREEDASVDPPPSEEGSSEEARNEAANGDEGEAA